MERRFACVNKRKRSYFYSGIKLPEANLEPQDLSENKRIRLGEKRPRSGLSIPAHISFLFAAEKCFDQGFFLIAPLAEKREKIVSFSPPG